MANSHTHFSTRLDLGSPAHVQRALALHAEDASAILDDGYDRYTFGIAPIAGDPNSVWITDAEGEADPAHVIAFVLHLAATLELHGRWGFAWAHTCSRPHLDAFGGGAAFLDLTQRTVIEEIDLHDWLGIHVSAAA